MRQRICSSLVQLIFCHLGPLLLTLIDSLAHGKFEWNFRYVVLKWILVIDGWGISCEIALIWMSLDFTDDQSELVQVMAWCCQATSHYLSQWWPRSLSPYGVTRPQWVNFNHSMDKWEWNCLSIPKLQWLHYWSLDGCTIEVWEWMSNFIPQFIMDVITYSCWS